MNPTTWVLPPSFPGSNAGYRRPSIEDIHVLLEKVSRELPQLSINSNCAKSDENTANVGLKRDIVGETIKTFSEELNCQPIPSGSTATPNNASPQTHFEQDNQTLQFSASFQNLEQELLGLIQKDWDSPTNQSLPYPTQNQSEICSQARSAEYQPNLYPFSTASRNMGVIQVQMDIQGLTRIIEVDTDVLELFEYKSSQDLLGHSCDVLLPPPYREQLLLHFRSVLLSSEGSKNGCLLVEGVSKTGNIFPLQVSWVIHPPSHGQPLGLMNITMFFSPRSIFDGCVISTYDNGTIVAVSETLNVLGYGLNDLLGQNISSYLAGLSFPLPQGFGDTPRNLAAKLANGKLTPACVLTETSTNGECMKFHKFRILPVSEKETVYFTITDQGNILTCSSVYAPLLLGYAATDIVGVSVDSLFTIQYPTYISTPSPVQQSLSPHQDRPIKRRRSTCDPLDDIPVFEGDLMPTLSPPAEQNYTDPAWWTKLSPRDVTLVTAAHKDGSYINGVIKVQKFNYFNANYYAVAFTRAIPPQALSKQNLDLKVSDRILNWQITEVICTGTSSRVVKGVDIHTGKQVAIKLLYRDIMRDADKVSATREMEILKRLSHPNVAQSYGIVQTPTCCGIVLEFLEGGNLGLYLEEKKRLSENEARFLFRQLVEAVQYCHSQNVIHRDLKMSNIILDTSKTQVKLIDFGLSNFMMTGNFHETFCGTPAFAAPEILLSQKYIGPEIDVWSLGVILFNMVSGYLPFGSLKDIIELRKKDLPLDVSYECVELIDLILTASQKRITVDKILGHRFLTGQ